SEHPLASAIVRLANERNLGLSEVSGFESIPGKGVKGRIDGKLVAAGNWAMMKDVGAFGKDGRNAALIGGGQGGTSVFIAVDGNYAGHIAVADPFKRSTPEALRQLKQAGIRLMMLTGDQQAVAQEIAGKLGITDFKAEVLPGQKSEVVRELQQQGRVVAM